jgi:flagellar hook protein FlgE
MKNTDLLFTTAGKYYSGSPTTTTMTLSNGALETQTITLDCNSLTQFAGNSTINVTADGNAAGTLKSVSIDSSGVITGVYTNGVKQSEAQIAIAQFTNASGLTKTGSSLYQASSNSGTPNVKTAADLGVSITPSALEMSNVDIANEFSDMIITQRGFQSNSKIITVSDEMLETMINMKR